MSERKKTSYSFRYNTETGEWEHKLQPSVTVYGNVYYNNVYNEQDALDKFEDKLAEMTREESFPDIARMLDKVIR